MMPRGIRIGRAYDDVTSAIHAVQQLAQCVQYDQTDVRGASYFYLTHCTPQKAPCVLEIGRPLIVSMSNAIMASISWK